MLKRTIVPVAVHMWFADGDGWAYHPDLQGPKLQTVMEAVDTYLFSPGNSGSFEAPLKNNNYILIGEKNPQVECQDPKARNRHPFILRVACMDRTILKTNSLDYLREQLQKIDLPTKSGCNSSLQISVDIETSGPHLPISKPRPLNVDKESEIDKLKESNRHLRSQLDASQSFNHLLETQCHTAQGAARRAKVCYSFIFCFGLLLIMMALLSLCFFQNYQVALIVVAIIGGLEILVSGVGLYLTRNTLNSNEKTLPTTSRVNSVDR